MKQKHFQLAKLYKLGQFFGYGVAVDGELLGTQLNTNIITSPGEMPVINVQFLIKESQAENPIIIHLDQHEQTKDSPAETEGNSTIPSEAIIDRRFPNYW